MDRREFLRGLIVGVAVGVPIGACLSTDDVPVVKAMVQDPFHARWITLEEFEAMYPRRDSFYEGLQWIDHTLEQPEECTAPERVHDGVWRHVRMPFYRREG